MAQGLGRKSGRRRPVRRAASAFSTPPRHGLFHLSGEEPAVADMTYMLRSLGEFMLRDVPEDQELRSAYWRNPAEGDVQESVNVLDLAHVEEVGGPSRLIHLIMYGAQNGAREAILRDADQYPLTLKRFGDEQTRPSDGEFMRQLGEDVERIAGLIMPPPETMYAD